MRKHIHWNGSHQHNRTGPWSYPVAFLFALLFFLVTGTRVLAWLLMKLYEIFISGNP